MAGHGKLTVGIRVDSDRRVYRVLPNGQHVRVGPRRRPRPRERRQAPAPPAEGTEC